ncbi:MAG: hypothetical protein LQ350_000305 [Teloschistes chrysophthalmus]|nr:MAG: hypothetical protein LQ350_000305 [Niorma chrysophthalma]
MGLVNYSESEGSDAEEKQAPRKESKPIASGKKPAFQKVVDRSNPHKVRVNLPAATQDAPKEERDTDEPPAKKAKTSSGAFSGFNSFLPAPKRAAPPNGASSAVGSRKGGLGSGVSLKTGAAPAFSRESPSIPDQGWEQEQGTVNGDGSLEGNVEALGGHDIRTDETQASQKSNEEPKKQGNSMMFKPLSVARKPEKKKTATNKATDGQTNGDSQPLEPRVVPKRSLFSTAPPRDDDLNGTPSSAIYQPMIYKANEPDLPPADNPQTKNPYIEHNANSDEPPPQETPAPGPQSLDSIASDLNLSASAKRQLFGRQKGNSNNSASAINIMNFNTDQEYAANELLRQAGEQIQHNPVKAIAPGKHSLKQLVNAASNQKDALEEQFASGRRNKKEAGSKYGW